MLPVGVYTATVTNWHSGTRPSRATPPRSLMFRTPWPLLFKHATLSVQLERWSPLVIFLADDEFGLVQLYYTSLMRPLRRRIAITWSPLTLASSCHCPCTQSGSKSGNAIWQNLHVLLAWLRFECSFASLHFYYAIQLILMTFFHQSDFVNSLGDFRHNRGCHCYSRLKKILLLRGSNK
jgi:hypothetical protein